MNSIIGEIITNIRFQNEYYDQWKSIGAPCFKNSSHHLLIETLSEKKISFFPNNENTDYELGITRVSSTKDLLHSVAMEPPWNSCIGKKITELKMIRDASGSLLGAELLFQDDEKLYIMCGDYEYNEIVGDFTVIPGTSGILIFFGYQCYHKYFGFITVT